MLCNKIDKLLISRFAELKRSKNLIIKLDNNTYSLYLMENSSSMKQIHIFRKNISFVSIIWMLVFPLYVIYWPFQLQLPITVTIKSDKFFHKMGFSL